MNMNNSRALFELMTDINYIKENVVGVSFEDSWLECKEKTDSSDGILSKDDAVNFAKAISGFANTEGGVLVFGLKARREEGGMDIVQGIESIRGIRLFESKLRENEALIVERPVSGIEYKIIYTDKMNDEGLLVVYIPDSFNTPHRSLKDHKFYLRAGGNFVSAPLSIIESLFLKKMKPDLELDFVCTVLSDLQNNQQPKRYQMFFKITNVGKALAKHAFVRMKIRRRPYKFILFNFHNPYTDTDFEYYDWVCDRVMHPGILLSTQANYSIHFERDTSNMEFPPALEFEAYVCAENMPPKTFSFCVPGEKMFYEFLASNKSTSLLNYCKKTTALI